MNSRIVIAVIFSLFLNLPEVFSEESKSTTEKLVYKFNIKENIAPAIWRQTKQAFAASDSRRRRNRFLTKVVGVSALLLLGAVRCPNLWVKYVVVFIFYSLDCGPHCATHKQITNTHPTNLW